VKPSGINNRMRKLGSKVAREAAYVIPERTPCQRAADDYVGRHFNPFDHGDGYDLRRAFLSGWQQALLHQREK
jgi:hypothetical protein